MKKSQGLNNAFQLLDGHLYFLENNTGLTVNPDNGEFILNPDFVLANNRHIIGRTGQESQPNNDATTEGQSLLVIGCAYAPGEGVFFGFHAGELLRGLSLYILYRQKYGGSK